MVSFFIPTCIAAVDFLLIAMLYVLHFGLHHTPNHFSLSHHLLTISSHLLTSSPQTGIYGGVCLAIRGPDCVVFFDWEDGTFIRKIDVVPTAIYWNEAGDSLVIVCSDCFYSLR